MTKCQEHEMDEFLCRELHDPSNPLVRLKRARKRLADIAPLATDMMEKGQVAEAQSVTMVATGQFIGEVDEILKDEGMWPGE